MRQAKSQQEVMSFCRAYYQEHKAEIDTLFDWQASDSTNMVLARIDLARAFLISRTEAILIWTTWKDNYDAFRLLYLESRNRL